MDKERLLKLDRPPTMEELKEYFRENDWSAAAIEDIDYETMPSEKVEALEQIKKAIDIHWEKHSQKMGMSPSRYYSKENPLIAMRDSMENLVSTASYKRLVDNPDIVRDVLIQFDFEDPEFDQKADAFLENAVSTAMQVMDYPQLAKVLRQNAAHEDFNYNMEENWRAMDFLRKWNHSRAKEEVVLLDDLGEHTDDKGESFSLPIADESFNAIEQLYFDDNINLFWDSLSEEDKKILFLKRIGLTTQEIADQVGLKTHSAVVKRIQKLKKRYHDMK